ncbi:MAG: dTDP-4-dehydrorhamnose 3,5-epimerase family protein [Candidatus Krumholzibacteria bacterium]|jgi:dTDP-4-dehydrorhamnose 3,5-epimerase|nr:dTDP-4-dehydrorhamnose 3,5-epimerase family protein [Candidatus Krumholzibacteria bacterium]MDP6797716.1 dTDP-4-dehydrorhamnose 3,5-epimerase family protein [Candidatus Krumholzibacteria bacterium]
MIDGVIIKDLKRIADERGYLMEILRDDDEFFDRFGQTYVSAVEPGVVKAWHYHREQTDHAVCVSGMIKLVMHDDREGSPTKGETQVLFIGDRNPQLVRIPKGVYHGWKGISTFPSLVINVPDRHYDYENPDEYREDPHGDKIPYDWSREDG